MEDALERVVAGRGARVAVGQLLVKAHFRGAAPRGHRLGLRVGAELPEEHHRGREPRDAESLPGAVGDERADELPRLHPRPCAALRGRRGVGVPGVFYEHVISHGAPPPVQLDAAADDVPVAEDLVVLVVEVVALDHLEREPEIVVEPLDHPHERVAVVGGRPEGEALDVVVVQVPVDGAVLGLHPPRLGVEYRLVRRLVRLPFPVRHPRDHLERAGAYDVVLDQFKEPLPDRVVVPEVSAPLAELGEVGKDLGVRREVARDPVLDEPRQFRGLEPPLSGGGAGPVDLGDRVSFLF